MTHFNKFEYKLEEVSNYMNLYFRGRRSTFLYYVLV